MTYKQGDKIKLRVEVIMEVSSHEYETTDSIIDEILEEIHYDFPNTNNVEIHNTILSDCQLT